MSMFPLSIFCLTTSNLPFMDLTFQVPMLCCSLQHRTFLHHQSQPHLGVVFLLAPSLHSFWSYCLLFSSSILVTYQHGEFMFQCYIFLPVHTVHGVLKEKILKWFAILFSSGPRFARTLYHVLSVLSGPTWHGS